MTEIGFFEANGWSKLNLAHAHDCLQWKREVGNPKERRYVRVAGVAPDIEVKPFINDLDTVLRGVTERVFYVKENGKFVRPPRPRPRVFEQRLAPTARALVA